MNTTNKSKRTKFIVVALLLFALCGDGFQKYTGLPPLVSPVEARDNGP